MQRLVLILLAIFALFTLINAFSNPLVFANGIEKTGNSIEKIVEIDQ